MLTTRSRAGRSPRHRNVRKSDVLQIGPFPVPEVLEPQAVRRLLLQAVEPVLAINPFRFEAATGRMLRESGAWMPRCAGAMPARPGCGTSSTAPPCWPAQRYRGSVRTTFSRMAWWTPREWPRVLAVHRADTKGVQRSAGWSAPRAAAAQALRDGGFMPPAA